MKRIAIGVLLFAATVIVTAPAQAQRIALHAQAFADIKVCTKNAPTTACDTFTDTVPAGTSGSPIQYSVYIVAVMDTVSSPANGGLTGIGFGIQYEPFNETLMTGLSIDGFVRCSTLEFPAETWPATNSGNVLTWQSCQTGASVANNVQAVGGAFQVTSYSAVSLNLIHRPANDRMEITTCPVNEPTSLDIPDNMDGWIAFAADGEQGCNPCVDAECLGVATEPTTWGKIKRSFGGE